MKYIATILCNHHHHHQYPHQLPHYHPHHHYPHHDHHHHHDDDAMVGSVTRGNKGTMQDFSLPPITLRLSLSGGRG